MAILDFITMAHFRLRLRYMSTSCLSLEVNVCSYSLYVTMLVFAYLIYGVYEIMHIYKLIAEV